MRHIAPVPLCQMNYSVVAIHSRKGGRQTNIATAASIRRSYVVLCLYITFAKASNITNRPTTHGELTRNGGSVMTRRGESQQCIEGSNSRRLPTPCWIACYGHALACANKHPWPCEHRSCIVSPFLLLEYKKHIVGVSQSNERRCETRGYFIIGKRSLVHNHEILLNQQPPPGLSLYLPSHNSIRRQLPYRARRSAIGARRTA